MDYRPTAGEYGEYYQGYISQLPEGDLLQFLRKQGEETRALILSLREEQALFRYEPGKWSVKEVFGHIIDCERIFAYRALAFARGEQTPLPGFEQDDYVENQGFDARSLLSLADEYFTLRQSNIQLYKSFNQEQLERVGRASGHPMSARAAICISIGHELHHLKVLKVLYNL